MNRTVKVLFHAPYPEFDGVVKEMPAVPQIGDLVSLDPGWAALEVHGVIWTLGVEHDVEITLR